jgi:CRP-like cAMP-binding protein
MGVKVGAAEYRVLRSAAMFQSLTPGVAHEILADCIIEAHPPDTELFHQGDPADAFYLVLDGWVKVNRVQPNGAQTIIGVFTRGQAFAEAIAIAGGVYPAAGQTVTRARVIRVNAENIRRIITARPEIALAMIASTSQHLHQLMQQLEQLMSLKAPERVAEFLLSLTDCASGAASIALPFDKTLIAGRLGMQPESLSRAFARLRAFGVRVVGSEVRIDDVASLREAMHDIRTTPENAA